MVFGKHDARDVLIGNPGSTIGEFAVFVDLRDETMSARYWNVRVRPRTPQLDVHGRDVLADVRQIGLRFVEGVRSSRLFLLHGQLDENDVQFITRELLGDPVCESAEWSAGLTDRKDAYPAIEIHAQPGVMDPVALSAAAAIRRLLKSRGRAAASIDEVRTARRYEVIGAKSAAELETVAARLLANSCIETWYIDGFGRRDPLPEEFPRPPHRSFQLRRVRLSDLDDGAMKQLSRDAHLFLSLEEMRAVQAHFVKLRREPTDLELETLAQTWSEHCVHKTLKSAVDYEGDDFGRPGETRVHFENLLKETIVEATNRLNRQWCLSVFADNAGIIAFDEGHGVAFKVETHNHPSAIEPYGGAATGVGGCIRDIMGCGLGAKPIASTDVFCLAPPDFDDSRIPKDVLHPRRVLKGVVSGVRDYGNRMGIPTVNGAIYFDERFLANPLVYCGCVGLIPRNRISKGARPGDRIVLAGGRTGRDGIHGATFSSAELTDTHADEFAHAVQIGNAIEEKKLLDALLLARDHPEGCLFSSVTDCGAGGLSSAVGEMGEKLGAEVHLEKVPLKYAGLRYDEIWISEAQERMVFAVPPQRLNSFLSLFAAEEVEATVIGTFQDDRVLRVRYNDELVGELSMDFLHGGLPRTTRVASWRAPRISGTQDQPSGHSGTEPRPSGSGGGTGSQTISESPLACGRELKRTSFSGLQPAGHGSSNSSISGNEGLLAALSELNVASKEWVIRQYDHEVQSRSVIKPLVGPGFGPSDAAVIRPRLESHRGIALACGLCPEWSDVDPYWMAILAVDEALRNVICVGANVDQVAILDNFCWPKVDAPESLGALVRACVGAKDAAIAYGLPFISGKDSLNNEFSMSATEAARTGLPAQLAIPGTLLISAIGIIEDVRRCISMDLKQANDCLVLASSPVDQTGLDSAFRLHRRVSELIRDGKVRAAHDVSDGGLLVTVAEMCIAAEMGVKLRINDEPRNASRVTKAWTPVPTSYVLEMTADEAKVSGWPILGVVRNEPRFICEWDAGDSTSSPAKSASIDLSVSDMAAKWRGPLSQHVG